MSDPGTFEEAHRALYPDIHRSAMHKQRIIGMSPQEVENEMVYALWKAWRSYDPTTGDGRITLPMYWWRVWMNHKANLIEKQTSQKRQRELLVLDQPHWRTTEDEDAPWLEELEEMYGFAVIPPCPVHDPLHQQVWNLLARGFLFGEVQSMLHMTRRAFKAVLDDLRAAIPAPSGM